MLGGSISDDLVIEMGKRHAAVETDTLQGGVDDHRRNAEPDQFGQRISRMRNDREQSVRNIPLARGGTEITPRREKVQRPERPFVDRPENAGQIFASRGPRGVRHHRNTFQMPLATFCNVF